MTKFAVPFLPGLALGMMMMTGAAKAEPGPQFIKLGHPTVWQEAGQASWYGGRHNGRRTSSGAIFNENAMTAAPAGRDGRRRHQSSATWSATYAPRRPSGSGGPSVESTTVCSSSSAFSSAPSRMA